MRFFAVFVFFAVSALIFSCGRIDSSRTELVMGTICSIDLFDNPTDSTDTIDANALYDELFARLRQIEAEFSVNSADSSVSRVNAHAGIAPVSVSEDFLRVLEAALDVAQKSQDAFGFAAFNPALGPLIRLWGIGTEHARIPAAHEIEAALPLCDITKIKIDHAAKTVFLESAGMALDLGGIVKGFAADELVKIIENASIAQNASIIGRKKMRAILNLGGNVYVYGKKNTLFPRQHVPWRIGVRNTDTAIALNEGSVVTSGDYERFFEQDAVRYHHILDMRTGAPAASGLEAVTVICNNSMTADALSTTVFVLGEKNGFEFVRTYFSEAAVITVDIAGKMKFEKNTMDAAIE